MKKRRFKFVWGAARGITSRRYLGLVQFYDRPQRGRQDGVAISVRGILLWLGGFGIAGYLAGATALFWIWQQNPYGLQTYTDALLYPLRRAEIAEKRGRAFIAHGQDLFRARKWHDAANLLRLGLARYPRDYRARMTLAHHAMMTNQRATAWRILQEGLTEEYPGRPYLTTLFQAAEEGENFNFIITTAARYEPLLRNEGFSLDRRWLLERQFMALLAADQPAAALSLAEAKETGDTANEHRVLALIALGRAAEAVAFLGEWRSRPGANALLVTQLQVRALREEKQFGAMERALAEMRGFAPEKPEPLVYAIVQQAMAGRDHEAAAALDEYLFRFAGNSENLALLAAPLAEIGHITLLQRVTLAAREQGYAPGNFEILLISTHVQRSEWEGAARSLAASGVAPLDPANGNAQIWRDWMQHLVEAASDARTPAQSSLIEFLRNRPWPMKILRQTIIALLRAGRLETAQQVLALATHAFPASRWLQEQSSKVKAQLAAPVEKPDARS